MVSLYTGVNGPAAVTVLGVLADQLLSIWAPAPLGFPFALVLGRQSVVRGAVQGYSTSQSTAPRRSVGASVVNASAPERQTEPALGKAAP